MKKEYCKPQIIFDNFVLSQDIAAGCEFISNANEDSCYVEVVMGKLFTSSACNLFPAPGFYDRICYDAPSDDSQVFSS